MGIKFLNRFLLKKCSKASIYRTSLQSLSGKTVVVDAYIYIYMFLGEDQLYEQMNNMVSTMLRYKITPIFIFDGKPPQEKKELLQERRLRKQEAQSKYREIIDQMEAGVDITEEMAIQMSCLKKQFLKVDQEHVQCVKSILREYRVEIVDAPGESDGLCVEYVKSNRAWACLSNDMDMFVYGVPRVLRNLSLKHHTVDMYDMQDILRDLHMDMVTFRQIMVLSGTDYNLHTNNNLYETMKWFYEYKKYVGNESQRRPTGVLDFYSWLLKYTRYIKDYPKLTHVYAMFDV